eukprot:g20800.t1
MIGSLSTVALSGGEGYGEEETDDVTWTTAFSLIGFLVMSTGVVYLVHCHDDDIRRASWDLVNTTLSIFCAASFDFGVVRALTTIILKIRTGDELTEVFEVEEEREKVLGDWRFILFVGAMACFWFFLLHGYLLHEDNHRRLFAASTLGGHLFAFAGILVFGHIQKYNPCWQWLLAVVLVALIFMVFLYGAILKYVKRNCKCDRGGISPGADDLLCG